MSRLVMKIFTSGGSWVAPAGVTNVMLFGAGGGSGGSGGRSWVATADNALGGTGVAPTMLQVDVVPNTSYTVTIGGGGTAGVVRTATGTNGGTGGNTTFGALATFQGAAQAASQTGANTLTTTSRPYQTAHWNQTSVSLAGFYSFRGVPPQNGNNPFANCAAAGTSNGTSQQGGLGGCPGFGIGGAGGNHNTGGAGQAGTAAAANTSAGGGGGGQGTTGGVGGAGGSGILYVIWVE